MVNFHYKMIISVKNLKVIHWIDFAEQQLQQYEKNNNHIIFLNIKYCLENRMPIMNMVTDDVLSENLEEYCLKIGTGIHFLSFDKYYGKMEMNAVYRFFSVYSV